MTTSRTLAQNLAQTPSGYRDLRVWRAAIELVAESYRLTSALPAAERFGLSARIQRAAVAIPANIAEGHGRISRGDYARFISIARGSLMELETLLEIVERLELTTSDELMVARKTAADIGRMLSVLLRQLRGGSRSPPAPCP